MSQPSCTHLNQIREVKPSAPGCEECLKMKDRWVHLRMCLTCGHATKHFRATSHPIIRSIEAGEDWRWCYVDELMME
jgi:hypothetical protein